MAPGPFCQLLDVRTLTAAGYYGIASNGTLVYVLGGAEGQLVWVDRAGKKVGEVGVSGTGLSSPGALV